MEIKLTPFLFEFFAILQRPRVLFQPVIVTLEVQLPWHATNKLDNVFANPELLVWDVMSKFLNIYDFIFLFFNFFIALVSHYIIIYYNVI